MPKEKKSPGMYAIGAGSVMDATSELIKLAQDKFGKLTPAEKKLFRAAARGEIADYSPRSKKPIDPANAAKWGPSRVLLADRIAWLCTDKQATQFIIHSGIQIKGARIDEKFELVSAKFTFLLCFELCKFTAEIDFRNAQMSALYMLGTHTVRVSAHTLQVDLHVYLQNGFIAEDEVDLRGARVGGDLVCTNAQFLNKDGTALSADGIKVSGGIFLSDEFKAEGKVRLLAATVAGDFTCTQCQFINKGGTALSLDKLTVGGCAYLSYGFEAEGEVRLLGATIGGDLSCTGGKFLNEGEIALSADGLKVGGRVYLRNNFEAEGEVRLPSVHIGGSLECDKSRFTNRMGRALSAHRLKVDGNVYLRNGFKAEGMVALVGATIGGELDCRRATFANRNSIGLFGNNMTVRGDVFLCDGLRAICEISLVAAQIDGMLHCAGLRSPREVKLDLRYARIGTLRDEQQSWPESGKLFLHGLVYKAIHNQAPADANSRIDWIQRQGDFWPQPYEQLANVLRDSGDGAGARDVLVAKNKDKAQRTKLTRAEWSWYRLFGPLIGYGHKPWLALPLALMIVLSGWVFFKEGYSHGLVTPLSELAYSKDNAGTRRVSEEYPVFNSLVYSIDVFIPVVDLHQVKYWLPNANRGSELVPTSSAALCTGGLLLFWLWIETALGWILTTLFLVGITGLVRT